MDKIAKELVMIARNLISSKGDVEITSKGNVLSIALKIYPTERDTVDDIIEKIDRMEIDLKTGLSAILKNYKTKGSKTSKWQWKKDHFESIVTINFEQDITKNELETIKKTIS